MTGGEYWEDKKGWLNFREDKKKNKKNKKNREERKREKETGREEGADLYLL